MDNPTQQKIDYLIQQFDAPHTNNNHWIETSEQYHQELMLMGDDVVDTVMHRIETQKTDAPLRRRFINILGYLGTQKAINALIRLQQYPEDNDDNSNKINYLLVWFGVDVFTPLIETLHDGKQKDKKSVAKALRALGNKGLNTLIAEYEDANPITQAIIMNELNQQWRRNPMILPYIFEGLRSRYKRLRIQAAKCLLSTGLRDEKICATLLAVAQKERDKAVLKEMLKPFVYHHYQPALPFIIKSMQYPECGTIGLKILRRYYKNGWLTGFDVSTLKPFIQHLKHASGNHFSRLTPMKKICMFLKTIGTHDARMMLEQLTQFEFTHNTPTLSAQLQLQAHKTLDHWQHQ